MPLSGPPTLLIVGARRLLICLLLILRILLVVLTRVIFRSRATHLRISLIITVVMMLVGRSRVPTLMGRSSTGILLLLLLARSAQPELGIWVILTNQPSKFSERVASGNGLIFQLRLCRAPIGVTEAS